MKISTQFMKSMFGFLCMLLLLAPLTVLAQTKVVVIPLIGDDAKRVNNIIIVAKANGHFTDPVAAVNSIKDASASNPYLMVIDRGDYTISQTLVMKPYVDITGSGENVTKIRGAISTDSDFSSVIIFGANNSALSSLTVENTGGSTFSIALRSDNASPTVSNVTAKASGATSNYGVFNNYYSSPKMTGVTATASGSEGTWCTGIKNGYFSSPIMAGVTATASGEGPNYGVYNVDFSSPAMTNVTITASGGTGNCGIRNESSSPTMTNLTITASGSEGTGNYGVYNYSSSPTMTGVIATVSGGNSYGVRNESSSPTMTNVTITVSGGTSTSYGVYNYSSSPTITGLTATALGETSYGVMNLESSSPIISRSTVNADSITLTNSSNSSVTVSQSTLIGVLYGGANYTCVLCDNGSGTALGTNCLAP